MYMYLYKFFSTNTIKLSMSSVIKQDNQKVLLSLQTNKKRQCNGRNPASCPLDCKCFTKNIVYKAFVSTVFDSYTYYGSSENLKFRYNNYTKEFRHQHYKDNNNVVNIYGTLKTQGFIITSPGTLPLMPQHTDVIQEDVISVSQKSTS